MKNILIKLQDLFLCKFKDDNYKSVNLDGILPHSGRRRKSSSKSTEIQRAQSFRDRAAKTASKIERPQFKLSKKSLESLYPPDKFDSFGTSNLLSSSPRADSSSFCSNSRMLLYKCPKILAFEDTLETDAAERKCGEIEEDTHSVGLISSDESAV